MKLTWFGGTTMRIHIGGAMLVLDADGAPQGIDRTELVSGADLRLSFGAAGGLEPIDPKQWAPRKATPLMDDAERPPLSVGRIGETAIVLDAIGEQPLLVVTGGAVERMGRWASTAVVVVMGEQAALPDLVANVLEQLGPKLIAVAGPDEAVGRVIERVKNALDGTGLVALEVGLGLEV